MTNESADVAAYIDRTSKAILEHLPEDEIGDDEEFRVGEYPNGQPMIVTEQASYVLMDGAVFRQIQIGAFAGVVEFRDGQMLRDWGTYSLKDVR